MQCKMETFVILNLVNKIMKKNDYYNDDMVTKHYGNAVYEIGLWKSEKFLINKFFDTNSKILDVGCGSGRTTFALYDLDYKNIAGIDLAENMIEQAKNIALDLNVKINFEVMDATNLTYSKNSYDNILFSFNGIESIPSKKLRIKCLQEIYKTLKPGGYFIFTTHNREESSFAKYWFEEKKLWEENKQNPNLEIYGDMFSNNIDDMTIENKIKLHIYSLEEMKTEIENNTSFKIIDIINRDKNFLENAKVQKFSTNCLFWILQK